MLRNRNSRMEMNGFMVCDNNGYILQFGQPVDEISSEG